MSAISPLNSLSPATRDVAEAYLASVEAALSAAGPEEAADTLDDVRAHLLERLDADTTPEEAAAVVAEIGAPEEFAAAFEAMAPAGLAPASGSGRSAGTFLGIPYDLRPPTAERVASRWWNPRDTRVFMPRAFGIGWDLNFGSIAVRLGLIEPDAEDEPFAHTPPGLFVAALAVPVALVVAIFASFVVLRGVLPAELPIHWDAAGRPDDYAPAGSAFAYQILFGALPTLFAVWSVSARRTTLSRGVSVAFGALFAALATALWAVTLTTALLSFSPGWLFPTVLLGSLVVPVLLLVAFARAGRAGEIARDVRDGREGDRHGGSD